jgi:hypothetical protein
MRTYHPKRASKRWLEGAPDYVLSCHDTPKYHDRYTVFFGGKLWDENMGRTVMFLGLSEGGASYWGELESYNRQNAGKKVRWLDLPERVREAVISRVNEGEGDE